ncbi:MULTISPECIES: mechanosensitive ion channel family protein [Xanthocytophaga]|uniref:Mechanosensitive ion channel n=2 Tax=Xanthocytophaga TaxID=3078918 RepID=A0AAE3QUL7_9BACT|nr:MULTISPECIES: mechanosensitive ion channel domain-containing protein [Xanthocytophaga]MDJ1483550.1 mechanosensitive ion channel [Xanthocytophaga flavus]MDJ1505456.1 mechanosensitive ion channel [Xanthocytophaga agilis]
MNRSQSNVLGFLMNLQKYVDDAVSLAIRYIPQLVLAILVLLIGLWIANRLTALLGKAMELRGIDVSLRSFLKSLLNIGLKILLLFSVADMIGIHTTSFLAVLGAAGLAIGLALQGSLSNFAGGVLILILHPYRVGDLITAQGQTGRVKEIQIFNTILLTEDGKTVILPNGAVSNSTIINLTTSGAHTFTVTLDINANSDFEKVKDKLQSFMKADERITDSWVTISKLTPAVMTISVTGTTATDNSALIQSDLLLKMKQWINEEKIA